ncbi:sugar phosphate isomerase/epimerase family protein [Pseudomonas sp. UBA4194]|uniref:sugar phosphate isomerase/epimerase family protein n=1 Tax=Pseudomonas sp. UBA4194 TaxID=1947317 RepID=UPI0025DF79F9|nr:sugar phosphate isomerase/epimerase [Pseudomonas sp. UBA4194]
MPQRPISLAALTVLEISPPDMVEVAARAGYTHVGLRTEPATPEEYHYPLLRDTSLQRQTAERLRDTGIKVLDIEILRLKPSTQVADFEAHLALGAEFGASELLVAGNDPDLQRASDNFAQLCDLARPYGIRPHLEFMPWTDSPDLTSAIELVERAGPDNGCILIDAFHFNRSGSRLEDLRQVAPQRMHYAQLCDVAGPRPDDMAEILRQARQERRFPGEGDCDLLGLLRALPKDIALSLEIPTARLLEQGVSAYERAKMALDRTREVLGRV